MLVISSVFVSDLPGDRHAGGANVSSTTVRSIAPRAGQPDVPGRAPGPAGADRAARLPRRRRALVAVPAAVGAVQLVPRLRLHRQQRLRLLRRLHAPELRRTPGSRATSACTSWNSVVITVPAVVLTLFLASMRGVRAGPVQLPVQPGAAGAVPGREPAAAAGAADPGLPDVPGDRGARTGSATPAPC